MSSKSSKSSRESELAEVVEVTAAPPVIVGRRSGFGWGFLLGLGVGAATMFLLDPHSGNRRRALVRDKAVHYSRIPDQARERLDDMLRDARNRANGMIARLRGQFTFGTPSDDVLVARVRSRLGHVVTHPSALDVTAHDGLVTLRGPILLNEVDRALMAVRLIPGVSDLVNQLETHVTADGVPGLQGTAPQTR